jgi:uncharacterized protein (TIGR03435 family)
MKHGKTIDEVLKRGLRSASHDPKEQVDAVSDRVFQRVLLRAAIAEATKEPVQAGVPVSRFSWPRVAMVSLAAGLLLAIVIVTSRPQTQEFAVVENADGSNTSLQAGEIVRAGSAGTTVVLADGSRVEMQSDTELRLEQAEDGLRIRLSRGGIIINAAEQRTGHLYVNVKDVTVSVVGTVFLVSTGEDGSRVAVIKGEVRVRKGLEEKNLLPGEQVATNPSMYVRPVREAIAWSRNAPALIAILQQTTVPLVVAPQNSAEPREAFEEAAVRPRPPTAGGGGRGDGVFPSGFPPACGASLQIDPRRFLATNITAYELITLAYDRNCEFAEEEPESGGLTGGPEWIRSQRFDIEALRSEDRSDYSSRAFGSGRFQYSRYSLGPRLRRMLQALLAERFNLVLRREMREMPAYELSVAKGGLKLTASKETEGFLSYVGGGGLYEAIKNNINSKPEYSGLIVGAISARSASMAELSSQLKRMTGRPVFDRTGIDGEFTYEFFFAPAQFRAWRRNPAETRPVLPKPSLFTVLEEELGLRLEEVRRPVEVLVIESVERPSPN